MPLALYALTAGAFGIGVTEFVIMGLLLEVSSELGVTIAAAGLLISALFPLMAIATAFVAIRAGRAPALSTPIIAS
jgi:DHA1 family inner membrane transport protein